MSALHQWQRRGDATRRDALWQAACWEAAAADGEGSGLTRDPVRCRKRAAEILEAAGLAVPASQTGHAGTRGLPGSWERIHVSTRGLPGSWERIR